jgi:hypothetical protein
MRSAISFAVAVALSLVAACGGQRNVGYAGPLPTAKARNTLKSIYGRTLPAGSVAFCIDSVSVHSFLVGPHGPRVSVDDMLGTTAPPAGRYWIPVSRDGDIADLHLRATGAVPAGLAMGTSETCRRFMSGKP